MKVIDILKRWREAINERVEMKPTVGNKEWLIKLSEDTNNLIESSTMERCEKCKQIPANIGGEYPCEDCGMPLVHDPIENMGWIRIEDDPPKDKQPVFVWFGKGDSVRTNTADHAVYRNGNFVFHDSSTFLQQYITHWMPVKPPDKGASHDQP